MAFNHGVLEPDNLRFTAHSEAELHFAKSLMEHISDAVFWIDSDSRLLYVNPAGCCLSGYSSQELLSMSMHKLDLFSAEVWLEHKRTIKQQGSRCFRSQYQNKQGWSIPVEVTVTVLKHHNKEYGCLFVRDISKCEQAKAALQKNKDVFEATLAERAAKLIDTNEQLGRELGELREALEQEQELSELRARFVSMVSHEFRTPLNIILFSTSLVRRHSHQWNEEKKLEYLNRIQTAVEQLTQLIDGVLLIGRAEAGKLSFEPRALDLEQFCRELVAEVQQSDSSHHTFTFVNRGDCAMTCLDEKLLQPILTNLLSNAIKYSAANSTVDFVVSCRAKQAIIEIKDQGIGISAGDQKKLFEPFYRGKNVSNISGTGLGLAVVKKLVDIHGGQIFVDSEIGVGSTFTIVLPSS